MSAGSAATLGIISVDIINFTRYHYRIDGIIFNTNKRIRDVIFKIEA